MANTKKIILLSILISQALVLHLVEAYIPVPYGIPGIKLGLSNIITLMVLVLYGLREAVAVVLVRTFLASMLGGMPTTFFYSVVGGLLSAVVMGIMYKKYNKFFSLTVISIIGAIFHNIGQLVVASLIINNLGVFSYLPVLLISGTITGFFVGLVASYLVPFIKNI
ncbi:MAG: Gx transporter family protein [Clostridia bacterium]|nr:Gx transporter family protein [Clostridia bacterium]